ncbi:unnamed protein product [Phytophthora fragariaefolia]|uniref:Unnamed protein product n=1 Tax=Phytophthora fragariaefolia TaxID=1490495 RepID=A0A9W6XU75_9STRA|nr:unnamed protein product [Phytophthora fragariaefolia]
MRLGSPADVANANVDECDGQAGGLAARLAKPASFAVGIHRGVVEMASATWERQLSHAVDYRRRESSKATIDSIVALETESTSKLAVAEEELPAVESDALLPPRSLSQPLV